MVSTENNDDYIEETSYVIMDMTSSHTEEAIRSLAKESGGLAITDMSDPTVYAQLGTEFYKGELDDPVGSYLLFELEEKKTDTSSLLPMLSSMQQQYRKDEGDDDDEDEVESRPVSQTKWQVKYVCQADKVLLTKQVRLEPKTTDVPSPTPEPEGHQDQPDMSTFLQNQ